MASDVTRSRLQKAQNSLLCIGRTTSTSEPFKQYFFRWCILRVIIVLDCACSSFSRAVTFVRYLLPSNSISSMNWRIRFLLFLTKSIKSLISSSLIPFKSTTFNLTGVSPTLRAASIPSNTLASISFLVISIYLSGRSVSRLILTLERPASFRSRATGARSVPFVVSEDSILSGTERIISTRSLLTSGSPPVNFTLVIPNFSPTLRISAMSSLLISSFGFCSPSAWQYIHLRLHFDVRLILRFLIVLLKSSLRRIISPPEIFCNNIHFSTPFPRYPCPVNFNCVKIIPDFIQQFFKHLTLE